MHLKWLTADRRGPYQYGLYPEHGVWSAAETPELCRSGWHACRWEDALHHVAATLWVCELDGPVVEGSDKVAGSRIRLVDRVDALDDRALRLFASDCAERVLPLFEARFPADDRPRKAIAAARAFARGEITTDAAGAAADAAYTAAYTAAGAAGAADAAYAAAGAAYTAAYAAAYAAAGAAAGAAYAEREWQTDRLLAHYCGLDPALFAHREEAA